MSGEVDSPRRAALELLTLVRDEGAYANLALRQILRKHALHGRDAAFTVELAYGVLRHQTLYDAIAQKCTTRDLATADPDIRDILRLGVHQLVSMRVPDHAAVNSSVELARTGATGGHAKARSGFVNAVLRCVIRGSHDEEDFADPIIRYSHPEWIVQAYMQSLAAAGRQEAELTDLLVANNTPARPVLALRQPGLEIEGTEQGRFSPQARVLTAGIPQEIDAVTTHDAIVQDEGSQLVVQAFLKATPIGPESAWLDMCAGPGGKAALISDAVPPGVSFTAVELHPHRADLVSNVVRPHTRVIVGDARSRPWGNMFFDRVLLDAPCTGLGALRRRPEARWRKHISDLNELVPMQEDLLTQALDSTRTGGVVCYVTCSPHLEETIELIDSVVQERDDVQVEDARPLFTGVPDAGPGPHVQLWPHIHGTDAMFFALLRRT